ncbi:MAG: secretin N-terminal domain-containing protein [Lacipirellulaceae bacterium]
MARLLPSLIACAALLAAVGLARDAAAQYGAIMAVGPNGQPMALPPGAMPPGAMPGGPPSPGGDAAKPGEEKKDGVKKDEKANEKKKDGPVERPDKPPRPADPRELEAKADADGRVRFSFHGQPWPDVMQWLANVSQMSLDWTELPPGYLNLTTQRSYTLVEARDLVNRHLQARGYCLVVSGEVLSVYKLDKLDPSLVPRVTEEQLYDLPPHNLAKLTLALPEGLDPAKAIEDLKQALSPTAKAMPLAATKQVLLLDTVGNLRMASALVNGERLAAEGRVAPREFILEHIQASEVIDTLYVVLGLDPNSRPSQMELQLQQQKLQLMTQMQQSGKDVLSLMKQDGPPVYLAYNRQRNSVLVNAPPKEMAIVERALESLDVPTSVDGAESAAGEGARTLRQYRLKAIEPAGVVSTLGEIGDLGPRTELRADDKSKTLFARATAADHEKIARLVEQLDSSGTRVEVFWLRRLPADAVAGTIQSLIIQPPEKKKENNNPFYFSWNDREEEPEEPAVELRVDADVENNRLVCRGTEEQLQQVRDLLEKLGEPSAESLAQSRVRVLDAVAPEDLDGLLERLKAAWPSVGGGTELVLPDAESTPPPGDPPAAKEAAATDKAATRSSPSPFRLANDAPPAPKRLRLSTDAEGRLVLSSDDPDALARMEELVAALAPEAPRFRSYRIKHLSSKYVYENLTDYFEEELAGDEGEQIVDWWGRLRGSQPKDKSVRLSKRRKLRFLYDEASNTVMVSNASPTQIVEVERLIELWDRPLADDVVVPRRTEAIKLRYARASKVAAAVKDVYRDLLSTRDREFDVPENRGRGAATKTVTTIRYTDGVGLQRTEPIASGFGGALSIGFDDAANVILVSAREELFANVAEMVRVLDEEAGASNTVRVLRLGGTGSPAMLSEALKRALPRADPTPAQPNPQPQR